LLLQDKGLVKTVKFDKPTYVGDPINAVKIFNDKEVDELVFLDIQASLKGKGPSFETITSIANECFMPLCYGGGVASIDVMKKIYGMGVEKIAINTCAQDNPNLIGEAARIFGSQSVVVSIDAKKNIFGKYEMMKNGVKRKSGSNPVEFARRMEEMGAGEILLNSVDRDGTMNGYDLPLIKEVSGAVGIPVIACGGAGEPDDFRQAIAAGAAAVAAGSMFVFYGNNRAVLINYPKRDELSGVVR
jgi:cyclase